jgi:hypothetical protein
MAVILRATAAEVNTVARVVERNSQVDVDLYGQVFPCPYYGRRRRANRGICLCGLRAIGRSWRPLSFQHRFLTPIKRDAAARPWLVQLSWSAPT